MEEPRMTELRNIARAMHNLMVHANRTSDGEGAKPPGCARPGLGSCIERELAQDGRKTLIDQKDSAAEVIRLAPGRTIVLQCSARMRHTATLALKGDAIERAGDASSRRASCVDMSRITLGRETERELTAGSSGAIVINAWTTRTRT